MKYAITISDMTDTEYRQVVEFISSMKFGGRPVQLVGTGEIGAADHINPAQITAAVRNVAAQVAASSGPAPADVTAEKDAKGVPYNPAFHSDARTKIKDGTWKLRKGGDRAAAEAYAAQFAVPAPATTVPQIPAARVGFAPPPAPTLAPPVLGFPSAPPPVDYNTFFEFASGLMSSGKLSMDNLAQLNQVVGVADASAYQTNDAARAAAYLHLRQQFPG